MHHKAFQLHFIISLPFCQKKHIDYHTCANLFNYPAILHLSKCSNRHLKLLPAQNARKYTTPKPQKRTEAATSENIIGLQLYFIIFSSFCQEKRTTSPCYFSCFRIVLIVQDLLRFEESYRPKEHFLQQI